MFSLDWKDIGKSLIMAVGTAALTTIQQSLDGGQQVNWKLVGMVSAGAAVTYLVKNLFTPAQVKTTVTNEQAKELKNP